VAKKFTLLKKTERHSDSQAQAPVPVSNPDAFFLPDVAAGRTLVEIPHDRVRPDPDQPRTEWAAEDLDDLQGKVEPAGRLLQPITVREDPDKPGYFVIKTGEGRWRVTGPDRLGWPTITCIIESSDMEADTQDVYANQILENIGKIAMRPLQLAQAIEKWMHGFDGKHKSGREAAAKFGLSETAISRYRKLLGADERIHGLSGRITNINTLTSLVDLSRMDEAQFENVIGQIDAGTLPNAERYLQQLVADLKSPRGKPKEGPPSTSTSDSNTDGNSELGGNGEGSTPPQKGKQQRTKRAPGNATPAHLQCGWNEELIEVDGSTMAVESMTAAEADGFAVLQFKTSGDQISLKLSFEQQLQLKWLLDKAAENH
jgi:ParB family chromosome partitioning protein